MNGLQAVLQRVERAKEQRRDLEVEVRRWTEDGAYTVARHRDPETGNTLFYIHTIKEITPKMGALIGEIIHSLRTALDHLAYQLFLICRTDPSDEGERIEFPIYDPAKRSEADAFRPIKPLRKEMIEAIRATNPYKGGNGTLWALHRLDIVDKHRRVLIGITSHHSVFVADAMRQLLIETGYGDMAAFAGLRPAFFTSHRTGKRAQVGDVVFSSPPDYDKVNEQLKFTCDVTFDEPGIVEGKSVIETLDEMLKVTENLVLSFEPFLV